jgi:transcriptional regulator with XRE-family HTH domain
MDRAKRKALEAAGFHVGDIEDFLELTDGERRLVELRLAASRAVRRLRKERGLTQQQLAAKLKSSQSRVARLETGAPDVSLDFLFRGLFAVGGGLADLKTPSSRRQAQGAPGDRSDTRREQKVRTRPRVSRK